MIIGGHYIGDVIVLPIEIGVFHGVTRKAFLGPTHRRMRCSGKIYLSKNKGLPPSVLHLTQDKVAYLSLATEVLGLVSTSAHRMGQDPET